MTDDTPKRSTIVFISGVVVIAVLLAAAVAVYPSDVPISDSLQQSQITRTGFGRTLQLLGKFDIAFCFMFFVCWATGNRRLLWSTVVRMSTNHNYIQALSHKSVLSYLKII